MAAAQAYQEQCLVYDQAFNAQAYHLNQAQQTGYVTAEALQFVLGPEIVKGAVKVGSRVMGLGAVRGVNQALKPLMSVSQSQAEAVAKAVGGRLSKLDKGFKIELGNPKHPTVIRLMNEGSGQRGQAYFRIAKQDYPAYTREGIRSTDHALTHIDLHTGDITQQIQEVLNKIPKK